MKKLFTLLLLLIPAITFSQAGKIRAAQIDTASTPNGIVSKSRLATNLTGYQKSIFPWEPTTPSYNTVPPLNGDSIRVAIDKAYNNATGTRFFYPSQFFYKYRYNQAGNNYYSARTASSTPTHVMMLGDSRFAYAPLSILDAYGQKGGLNSIGFVGPYANIFGSGMTTYTQTGTFTVTRNDNTSAATFGIAGQRMDMTAASTWTVKPNDRYMFDRERIFYLKTVGGGSFSYANDGGGATTVNTAHASGPDSLGVVTISSGLNTQASHSLALTWVSGTVRLYGVEFDNQAESGYVVDIIQSGGSRSGQWDKLSFLSAYTALTTPAQTTIWLDVNDATSSVSASTYIANIKNIITGAGLPALSSTILMGWWPKQTSAGSGVEDLTADAFQAQYAAQKLLLVTDPTYNTSYYDLRAKLPSFAQMVAAGMWSDDEHPNINYAPDIWFQLVDNIVPNSTNPISAGTFETYFRNPYLGAPNGSVLFGLSTQNGAGGLTNPGTGWGGTTQNGANVMAYYQSNTKLFQFFSDNSTNTYSIVYFPTTAVPNFWRMFRLNSTTTPGFTGTMNSDNSVNFDVNNNALNIGLSSNSTSFFGLKAGTTSRAPMHFTSGTNLTTPLSGAVEYDGAKYYMTNTGGVRGTVPLSFGNGDLTAQTTAGNIATYTVGSTTQTFNVSSYLNVTAIATDVIEIQITYTDENSTAQTVTLATLSAIGNSTYNPVTIRAKNATVITVKTTLAVGGGTVTFDAGARITQI